MECAGLSLCTVSFHTVVWILSPELCLGSTCFRRDWGRIDYPGHRVTDVTSFSIPPQLCIPWLTLRKHNECIRRYNKWGPKPFCIYVEVPSTFGSFLFCHVCRWLSCNFPETEAHTVQTKHDLNYPKLSLTAGSTSGFISSPRGVMML